ncbi:MAG: T9SS type A sorting domain-containing protein [Bacteroidales bacterium]|jgi:hypothetical protein|nr:T9SS type A sorting domain-containing protein [Bacteroidales bacterium]
MKSNLSFFVFLVLLFAGNISNMRAQIISYKEYMYDAAGNRIARKVWILSSNPTPYYAKSGKQATDTLAHPASYEEQVGTVKFTVFPNPTTGIVTLQMQEGTALPAGNIVVCNMTGQVLLQQSLTEARATLDLAHLPPGTYLLKLFINNTSEVWKIIKN